MSFRKPCHTPFLDLIPPFNLAVLKLTVFSPAFAYCRASRNSSVCQKWADNLLITGQAGTGNSTVVNSIRDECHQQGPKVNIVCSSGIACSVYEAGTAFTVHS